MAGCERTFFETEESVPLDAAIYSSSQNKIYGVRGQFIFAFDPVTGTKTDEFRYVDDVAFSEASIVEVGVFLYVGVWRPMYDQKNGTKVNMDIFAIDHALTNSVALGLNLTGQANGYCNLVTDGTNIYGLTGYSRGTPSVRIFQVDPTNIATYVARGVPASRNDPVVDLVWDPTNLTIWQAENNGPGIDACYYDIGSLFPFPLNIPTPTVTLPMYGLTVAPGTQVYAVTKTADIVKLDGATAVSTMPANYSHASWVLLNLLPAGANPIKIKYNPYDGLIYVPNWAHDSVSIIDPATDSAVDVITGFSSPFDVVFSPVAKFAVQLSSTGLRKITT